MTHDNHSFSNPLAESLTQREVEILVLLTRSRTNRQIAEELILAQSTVRWYLRQIYAKLGVKGRREAVDRAVKLGLVTAVEDQSLNSNLPVPPTPFLGRETELKTLGDLIMDSQVRLLTLLGPGGIGKTRLAQELAGHMIARMVPGSNRLRFPDGVWYVSLAEIDTETQFVHAIAGALQLQIQPAEVNPLSAVKQISNYLQQKNVLLVLDNLEHLLESGAILSRFLERSPNLNILATSRRRLNLQGEHLFWIEGLEVPANEDLADMARNAAVRLFVSTASRLGLQVEAGDEDLLQIVQICELLQGMPLAIEMAASWSGILSIAEINQEVRKGIDILVTELQDIPVRHRSMQATIKYSWDHLTLIERDLLCAFSIFRGGFTSDAAREVAGANKQDLRRLVEASWLTQDHHGRYHMHEVLRQFGLEEISRREEFETKIRSRHGVYHSKRLKNLEADLKGPGQQEALDQIEVDFENYRMALDWAVKEVHWDEIRQMIFSLVHFFIWRFRSHEGEELLRTAVEELEDKASLDILGVCSIFLTWMGYLNYLNNYEKTQALKIINRSLKLLEGTSLSENNRLEQRALIFLNKGRVLTWSEKDSAEKMLKESLSIYKQLGKDWMTAHVMLQMGALAQGKGLYQKGQRLIEESLKIFQAFGDQLGIIFAQKELAFNKLPQGEFDQGEQMARAYLANQKALGKPANVIEAQFNTGRALIWAGAFREGLTLLEDVLNSQVVPGMEYRTATALAWLGHGYCHLGEYDRGEEYTNRSLNLFQETGTGNGIVLWFSGQLLLAMKDYDQGRTKLNQSLDFFSSRGVPNQSGLVLGTLGHLSYLEGERSLALEYLCQALHIALDIRAFMPLYSALPVLSSIFADQGQIEQSVALYTMMTKFPPIGRSRWFEMLIGQHIQAVASGLPEDIVESARQQGRNQDPWKEAEKILSDMCHDDPGT